MTRSLRIRIFTSVTLCSAIVLGLLGMALCLSIHHVLIRDFDTNLAIQARQLPGMLEWHHGMVGFDFDAPQMPDFLSPYGRRYFQMWEEGGREIAKSPSLEGHDLGLPQTNVGAAAETVLPSGHPARILYLHQPLKPSNGMVAATGQPQLIWIAVAADTTDLLSTLSKFYLLIAISCGAAIVILCVLLVGAVSHGLRSVTQVAASIESLKETDLHRRLPADGVPAELLPVVEKLNGLLSRVAGAFDREKAFTADVSHEFRTPIAGLQAILEVCRSQPRERAGYEAAIDECCQIVDRMGAMVGSLLLLARADGSQAPGVRSKVDLVEQILDCWEPLKQRAAERGLQITFALLGQCTFECDVEKLQIILSNLLDNAVSHTEESGAIDCSVTRDDKCILLEVANSGSRISAEESERVFDRLWQGDPSRSHTGLHSGLGLALTKRLVTLLGGQISVATTFGGRFIVTVSFAAA